MGRYLSIKYRSKKAQSCQGIRSLVRVNDYTLGRQPAFFTKAAKANAHPRPVGCGFQREATHPAVEQPTKHRGLVIKQLCFQFKRYRQPITLT
jgi:hypothetical protein